MKSTICKVKGMHCAACSAAVERTLNSQGGVAAAAVNLASEEARIDFDEAVVSEDELSLAVKKAGYTLVFPASSGISDMEKDSEDESRREERREKIRLSVAVLFAVPLFVLCMGHMVFPSFPHAGGFLQLFLCLPVLAAGSGFFLRGFRSLFHGTPNMDSLVAVGSGVSFLYSLYNLFSGSSHSYYFDSVAMIITFVMVGKYIESGSKRRAGASIKALIKMAPSTATVIVDGGSVVRDVSQVFEGDIVLVKPGEKIPTDGLVVEGEAEVNESMLTGESVPVHKADGSAVYAATINTNSSFMYRVTKTGADTVFSGIIRMVREAQSTKAPISRLADRVAGVFVPVVMTIAAIVFVLWMTSGRGLQFSLTCAVSVLVIACPCSLGLATPIAIVTATGRGANLGILFKSAEVLENLGRMKNVMFDKTGTLTTGHPVVTEFTDRETLRLAAIAEGNSEHPFSRAVLDKAREVFSDDYEVQIPAVKYFTAVPGQGIIARLDGRRILAGNRRLMEEREVKLPDGAASWADLPDAEIYVSLDSVFKGTIRVMDAVRPESAEAVKALKDLGLTSHMLTGDNAVTARDIADECGISEVHASLLPEDKLRIVRETERSMMVGDGINDAPSLEAADIGLAMGGGTDVAISSADVVIMKDDLGAVPVSVRLSRATIGNIKMSLFWAFFYNILGIPIAAGALTFFGGPLLDPMLCALCMSASSVSVVLNALRLRKFK